MFDDRNRAVIGASCFVAAVIYAVLFLALDFEREAGDWVCFGCTLFALLLAAFSFAATYTDWLIVYLTSGAVNLLLNLSYAVLQLVLGVLLVAIPSVPLWVVITACSVLLALEIVLTPYCIFLSVAISSVPDSSYPDFNVQPTENDPE